MNDEKSFHFRMETLFLFIILKIPQAERLEEFFSSYNNGKHRILYRESDSHQQ